MCLRFFYLAVFCCSAFSFTVRSFSGVFWHVSLPVLKKYKKFIRHLRYQKIQKNEITKDIFLSLYVHIYDICRICTVFSLCASLTLTRFVIGCRYDLNVV